MKDLIPSSPAPGGEFLFYQTEDGRTRLQVRVQDETVWLSQKLMADLFQKDVRTINEHIQNIFEERELSPDSVIRKFRITAADGKNYETAHYNLDVIISQVEKDFDAVVKELKKLPASKPVKPARKRK